MSDITVDRELLERLIQAAKAVAGDPPEKPGKYVGSAKVYWPRIQELRAALEAANVEWRRR